MFNGQRALIAAFFVILAVQTWRFIKNPPSNVPLQGLPPPYIYTGTIVVFAMLSILGSMWDQRVAGALGIGLALGVVMAEAQNKTTSKKSGGGGGTGPPPTLL